MESPRLILAPQLPIRMRYQEWWLPEIMSHLKDSFSDIKILGSQKPVKVDSDGFFSAREASILNENNQILDFMDLDLQNNDVLLHCDLSYPGLFHTVLAHKRPAKAVVICHASARNNHDVFAPIRDAKWTMEQGAAALYDRLLVATNYHRLKLQAGLSWQRTPEVRVLGALPHPPEYLYKNADDQIKWSHRPLRFVSVARDTSQKVNHAVEGELGLMASSNVIRETFSTWKDYYGFLGESQFMIITSREETYGYQVVDALKMGCIPIAPRAFSYPELLPDESLYDPRGLSFVVASRIWDKVKQYDQTQKAPQLKCDNTAQNFWEILKKELLEW